MRQQPLVLVLLILVIIVVLNREHCRRAALPVFFAEETKPCLVELGCGFFDTMERHIIDVNDLEGVMKMTSLGRGQKSLRQYLACSALRPGQSIDLVSKNRDVPRLTVSYMGAAKQIALGIALHPDQMTEDDWQILPGIGPSLAALIILDRQENGDFVALENLKRVKGISRKKIAQWRSFF
ncbi:MAG: helix-hairpin-helix domain-containing protein [Desulfuromonas sp.]|nr:helix-hairpin-helix domain-containing protein [Desulfuromonas sp.]